MSPIVPQLAMVIAAVCATTASAASPQARPNIVAFVHTSVVPMDHEHILKDHTVVVSDGKITALGPASKVPIPPESVRIEGRGRYLMPALSDMHVHIEGEAWEALLSPEAKATSKNPPFEDFLFPYVANGVTTVQVLSGTHELLPVRGKIAEGAMLAPRLILARMIDGPDKAWPPPLSTMGVDRG